MKANFTLKFFNFVDCNQCQFSYLFTSFFIIMSYQTNIYFKLKVILNVEKHRDLVPLE